MVNIRLYSRIFFVCFNLFLKVNAGVYAIKNGDHAVAIFVMLEFLIIPLQQPEQQPNVR